MTLALTLTHTLETSAMKTEGTWRITTLPLCETEEEDVTDRTHW